MGEDTAEEEIMEETTTNIMVRSSLSTTLQ